MTDACFNLRSWASNSSFPRERAAKDNTSFDTSNVVNILGLKWNLLTDTLSPTTHETYQPSSQPITKRTVGKLRQGRMTHLDFCLLSLSKPNY